MELLCRPWAHLTPFGRLVRAIVFAFAIIPLGVVMYFPFFFCLVLGQLHSFRRLWRWMTVYVDAPDQYIWLGYDYADAVSLKTKLLAAASGDIIEVSDRELKSWMSLTRRSAAPEQRYQIRVQRKSWMVGEMLLKHPELTREEADRIYDEVVAAEELARDCGT
jgi:hypothetical protein